MHIENIGSSADRGEMPEGLKGAEGLTDASAALVLPLTSESEPSGASEFRMCFRVGSLGLLFPSNDGREVVASPVVSRVPNTRPWLRGLANVRGELVPVIDAAAAFGVARQSGAPVYLLIFGQGESVIGLLIDGLPSLFNLTTSQRLSEVPLTPALLTESVQGAYEHAGRTWLDIDLSALFDALAGDMRRE